MAIASVYQNDVANYWNAERNPVNLRLGDVSGIYHHHYGVGEVDWSDAEPEVRMITQETHIGEWLRRIHDEGA